MFKKIIVILILAAVGYSMANESTAGVKTVIAERNAIIQSL